MRIWPGLFIATVLFAQQNPSANTVQGEILERNGDAGKGDFAIRLDNNRVYWCLYDSGTRFERNQYKTTAERILAKDRVELTADMNEENFLCYAREVKVANPPVSPLEQEVRQLLRKKPGTLGDLLFPRGNLTYAGVIRKVTPERITVHTRQDGNQVFLVRSDTGYFAGGLPAELSSLVVNTRVYIRAGKSFLNELEVYQVMWGEIIEPQSSWRE
jgi:hypothetical protein